MNIPVSFEIAKLLKEKGFETETCYKGWHGDFGDLKGDSYPFLGTYTFFENLLTRNIKEHQIESPIIAEVVMWLYEKHEIWITSLPITTNKWYWEILCDCKHEEGWACINDSNEYNSPTEAYEAAIKYVLNKLI